MINKKIVRLGERLNYSYERRPYSFIMLASMTTFQCSRLYYFIVVRSVSCLPLDVRNTLNVASNKNVRLFAQLSNVGC